MKLSPCRHCQMENPDDSTGNCPACAYHPWNMCHHPDCGKLPPIKHQPRTTPPRRSFNPSPSPSPPPKKEETKKKEKE
ncbi:hypothetical protein F5Y03DRAFT_351847 [Xylaria venustula]|nr:hypothetical protein F5Y03DRAFT_351847 [Xylaria venustula]